MTEYDNMWTFRTKCYSLEVLARKERTPLESVLFVQGPEVPKHRTIFKAKVKEMIEVLLAQARHDPQMKPRQDLDDLGERISTTTSSNQTPLNNVKAITTPPCKSSPSALWMSPSITQDIFVDFRNHHTFKGVLMCHSCLSGCLCNNSLFSCLVAWI